MKFLLHTIIAVMLLALGTSSAEAGRRSLRIEFQAWSEGFALGSAECPGSSIVSDNVSWNGFNFIGSSYLIWTVDTYCQTAATYQESLGTDEYLNSAIFGPDEAGLAGKIGANQTEPFITARRYTFLDGPRFDEGTQGFQWAFYFFPNGITLVTIYGEVPIDYAKFDPYITDGVDFIWDSLESGYNGEYFCFDGTTFIGFWDGAVTNGSPQAGCALPPPPEEVFNSGFEESENP